MSGTVCCYVGCKKSYSTDKEVSFFKFPDDPKRRKKWMQNSGNLELESLSERQLRGKRICSDHFTIKSFSRPESKTTLIDSAVPIVAPTPKAGGGPAAKPAASATTTASPAAPSKNVDATPQKRGRGRVSIKPEEPVSRTSESSDSAKDSVTKNATPAKRRKLASPAPVEEEAATAKAQESTPTASKSTPGVNTEAPRSSTRSMRNAKPGVESVPAATAKPVILARKSAPPPPPAPTDRKSPSPKRTRGRQPVESGSKSASKGTEVSEDEASGNDSSSAGNLISKTTEEPVKAASSPGPSRRKSPSPIKASKPSQKKAESETSQKKQPESETAQKDDSTSPKSSLPKTSVETADTSEKSVTGTPKKRTKPKVGSPVKPSGESPASPTKSTSAQLPPAKVNKQTEPGKTFSPGILSKAKTPKKDLTPAGKPKSDPKGVPVADSVKTPTKKPPVKPSVNEKQSPAKPIEPKTTLKQKTEVATTPGTGVSLKLVPSTTASTVTVAGVTLKKKKKAKPEGKDEQSKETVPGQADVDPVDATKLVKKRRIESTPAHNQETAKIVADQVSQMQAVLLPSSVPSRTPVSKLIKPVLQKVEMGDNVSEADSYDEYMYFDRDFEEACYDEDPDGRLEREFERFYASLKKFLHLSGKWTMGGVQWDPQGKRKVIIISEPEIPPNGRPCVKRCLQFFEDKAIRVFIDGMDMTDVFGMSCYAEKEDVANLICRVADASSCCGVPEMVIDDVINFPYAKKRNTSYFDSECPGVIPNDSYDPMCSSCKHLQELVMESRNKEKERLLERRLRSQEKEFQHPFGQALYAMFSDLVDETDPTKPKKKRTKETFFRKYLHDTRYKMDGDSSKTERVYIEKPISVDSVSASFQDIVSKLGFNMPNAKTPKTFGSAFSRPSSMTSTSTPKPTPRVTPGSSSMARMERKTPLQQVEHILPFPTGSSFTLDDGQEYELIGEVDQVGTEIVEMKPTPSQQYEIIEVDDETLAKLASAKNPVVVLPDAATSSSNLQVTRIDANDPNLSQILKAINTSHGYKMN